MDTSVVESVRISSCVTCASPLPTLIVGPGPSQRQWECGRCGASYLASLDSSSGPPVQGQLKLVHYFPQHMQNLQKPGEFEAGVELRRHRRRPITMHVPVAKLDDHHLPIGENFEVLSRDLSEGGIALLYTEPLEGKLAALVAMPDSGHVQLLMEVVRQRQAGPLYQMGCKFFDRIRC